MVKAPPKEVPVLFNHNDTGPVAYRHCTKNGAKAQPKCASSSIISFITKTFSAPRCIVTPLDCQPLDYTKPLRLQILPTKHTTRVRVHKPTSCRRYHILVRTLTTLANVFCFYALLSFCAAPALLFRWHSLPGCFLHSRRPSLDNRGWSIIL